MQKLSIRARVFGADDKPLASHRVSIQMFNGSSGKWVSLRTAVSNQQGHVTTTIDAGSLQLGSVAPALRLTESGKPTTRVLSAGPMLRLDARTKTLVADFGEVERLASSAYARPHLDSGQSHTAGSVAGVPRKAGLNQNVVMTTLASNTQLREAVSGGKIPTGGLVMKPNTAGGTAIITEAAAVRPAPTAETGQAAEFSSREVDTLKAINLEKDAVIVRKDQDLIARNTELTLTKEQLISVRGQLSQAQTQAAAATERARVLEAEKKAPAEVVTLVSGLGAKLSDANQKLKTNALPFRLGAVKIDLRGRLTNDGSGIVMGEEIKGDSGFSAELHADQPSRDDQTLTVAVPDAVGLTTAAAQRVLRSVGLRIKVAQQNLAPGKGTPGQALSQHPAAGQTVPHGTEVLVVFGVAV